MVGVVVSCLTLMDVQAAEKNDNPGEKTLHLEAVYPVWLQHAKPADGIEVKKNPPALLWPMAEESQAAESQGVSLEQRQQGRSEGIRYSVRLSQKPDFPDDATISAQDIQWAMFNPHRKLETGNWYWKYSVKKADTELQWSETYSFVVTDKASVFETPTPDEMLERIPDSHPRIMATADEINKLRRCFKNSPEAQKVVKRAESHIGAEILRQDWSPQAEKLQIKGQAKVQLRNLHTRYLGIRLRYVVTDMSMAYLLTGRQKYADEAIRLAMKIAGWDPNGITAKSDFCDGSCLSAMAVVYDTCYDSLSEQQKKLLRKNIKIRANHFYPHFVNRLESRVIENHAWQLLLRYLHQAGLALLGEEPQARLWLAYPYELWLARFPVLGGDDGGWANGNWYLGVNYNSMIYFADIFSKYTGSNFYEHPWFRNVADFLIYTQPPNSYSSGFGDGHENNKIQRRNRVAFADILARKYNDQKTAWYVDRSLEEAGSRLSYDRDLQWYRLVCHCNTDDVSPKRPDLPQAHLFGNIGEAAMHTDITDTANNLMLTFRSSPYGCFGHMHANQNAFNILYGGKPLFYSSGYYTSFADKFNFLCYRHSRAHNTVLADGFGQALGVEGYGWIPRWLHGKQITYCLGDASNAYGPIKSEFWLRFFKDHGVQPGKESGYGDSGLKRFRRHLVMLRPSVIVVYDELEADHDVEWSWLLHSPSGIRHHPVRSRLTCRTETAQSQVDIFASEDLKTDTHDRFFIPAVNWMKKTVEDPFFPPAIDWPEDMPLDWEKEKPVTYSNQWHAEVNSADKSPRMRYLAVIQVKPLEDKSGLKNPVVADDGWIQVDNWKIRAELDIDKNASLEICNSNGTAGVAFGKSSVTVAGKNYTAETEGSTLLVEVIDGKTVKQETVDR